MASVGQRLLHNGDGDVLVYRTDAGRSWLAGDAKLIYCRAQITADCPIDIKAFRLQNPHFLTTRRFGSYSTTRPLKLIAALGYHNARSILRHRSLLAHDVSNVENAAGEPTAASGRSRADNEFSWVWWCATGSQCFGSLTAPDRRSSRDVAIPQPSNMWKLPHEDEVSPRAVSPQAQSGDTNTSVAEKEARFDEYLDLVARCYRTPGLACARTTSSSVARERALYGYTWRVPAWRGGGHHDAAPPKPPYEVSSVEDDVRPRIPDVRVLYRRWILQCSAGGSDAPAAVPSTIARSPQRSPSRHRWCPHP